MFDATPLAFETIPCARKSSIKSTGLLKFTPDMTKFSNHATAKLLSLNRDLTFPPILLGYVDQLKLVRFW